MVKGIGTDIADNSRFSSLPEGFLLKVFTPYEISTGMEREGKGEYFASRFAAKEAVAKAYGTGFRSLSPLDIEIREEECGRPYALICGRREKSLHVSLSHEKSMSVAFAVLEGGDEE